MIECRSPIGREIEMLAKQPQQLCTLEDVQQMHPQQLILVIEYINAPGIHELLIMLENELVYPLGNFSLGMRTLAVVSPRGCYSCLPDIVKQGGGLQRLILRKHYVYSTHEAFFIGKATLHFGKHAINFDRNITLLTLSKEAC